MYKLRARNRISKDKQISVITPKILFAEPTVLFEDKHLLIINKPSGLIVTRDKSVKEKTVEDWIESKFSNFGQRSGIVHRLDKETSGILLVAKDQDTFLSLQKEFKERKVQKTYLALTHGIFKEQEGEVDAPVGRLPWNRERFGVFPGGRAAKTKYKVLKEYGQEGLPAQAGEKYSLVEWYPKTGRTHQIRVHAKYLGHTIVSDTFYAGRKTARRDRLWCPRLFLHASKISFNHPQTGEEIAIEAQLPEDLQKALTFLASN